MGSNIQPLYRVSGRRYAHNVWPGQSGKRGAMVIASRWQNVSPQTYDKTSLLSFAGRPARAHLFPSGLRGHGECFFLLVYLPGRVYKSSTVWHVALCGPAASRGSRCRGELRLGGRELCLAHAVGSTARALYIKRWSAQTKCLATPTPCRAGAC